MVTALAVAFGLLAASAAAQDPDPASGVRAAVVSEQDARTVLTLTRSTLVALAQANETGDYSVLNALASPGFRSERTAEDMAAAFAPMREARIDLLQAAVLDPMFDPPAVMDAGGWLWIRGTLALTPRPLRFELAFEPIGGVWRLSRVAVEPAN